MYFPSSYALHGLAHWFEYRYVRGVARTFGRRETDSQRYVRLWWRLRYYGLYRPRRLAALRECLMRRSKLTRREADDAIAEYLKFIFCAAVVGPEHLVGIPSRILLVWNLHQRDGEEYRRFCGLILENRPVFEAVTCRSSDVRISVSYSYLRDFYTAVFRSRPDASIWPIPTSETLAKARAFQPMDGSDSAGDGGAAASICAATAASVC